MNIQELARKFSNDEVFKRMREMFGCSELYIPVLETIAGLETVDSNIEIAIRSPEYYNDVIAIDLDDLDDLEPFAIDLIEWEKVAGMEISYGALNNFSELDILCHVLVEITFYGFTQDEVQKVRDGLGTYNVSVDDDVIECDICCSEVDDLVVCEKDGKVFTCCEHCLLEDDVVIGKMNKN